MALVQFGGDEKRALESHRIVSLDRQGDPLKKVLIKFRFSSVSRTRHCAMELVHSHSVTDVDDNTESSHLVSLVFNSSI